MRNKVVLSGGYVRVFMHSEQYVCDPVVFSGSVLNSAAKGNDKLSLSTELLAV